ncbi:hypothetical protein F5X96DRAFT_105872 [Biscogniauxia mediterranea]|nr:hypothetical protein F5X96DRAFT_105872 [Biscogniauxia mediterranea]
MAARRSIPQSFRDRDYFPAFADVPGDHVADERYLVDVDPAVDVGYPAGSMRNRKHWCLLGEILQADTLMRPRIVARDARGGEFVVTFYPDEPGDMPRLLRGFKPGRTIAIMYALGHYFLDGTAGVRVEETDQVIIIPLKLDEVLAMNGQAVEHTVAPGTPQKCHACGEAKENMNKCARCLMFYYCGQDCQAKGWNEKGHKKYCKVLKDENVKTLHFLDYSTYQADISFKTS